MSAGLFPPLSCEPADLLSTMKGIVAGLLGVLPLFVASAQPPHRYDGAAVVKRAAGFLGGLLLYDAIASIETDRASCGQELLQKVPAAQCVEHLPAWLMHQHTGLKHNREFQADLEDIAALSLDQLPPDAIRAAVGSVLLKWIPVEVLRRDIANFLGE